MSNKKCIFNNKIAESPNHSGDICVKVINDLPERNRKKVVRQLTYKSEQDTQAEISSNVLKSVKKDFGPKSEVAYSVTNAMSPYLEGKSINYIRSQFNLNNTNANKVKFRKKLKRKVYQ